MKAFSLKSLFLAVLVVACTAMAWRTWYTETHAIHRSSLEGVGYAWHRPSGEPVKITSVNLQQDDGRWRWVVRFIFPHEIDKESWRGVDSSGFLEEQFAIDDEAEPAFLKKNKNAPPDPTIYWLGSTGPSTFTWGSSDASDGMTATRKDSTP